MNENPYMTERARSQVLGCMVGGAVGDALGYAVEFDSWNTIRTKYGPQGITRFQLDKRGVARISDDTQMSLFTAAGIPLGMTRFYMRGIMGRIDSYCQFTYIDWLHTQEWRSRHKNARVDSWLMDVPELYSQRAPGRTCLTALRDLEQGKEPSNNSCGCGGVMRTAPIALLSSIHGYADGDKIYCNMCAAEAARITHKHPLGFIPSAILNDILMEIMSDGETPDYRLEYYVEQALKNLSEIKSEYDREKLYEGLWPKHIEEQKELINKALDLANSDKPDQEAIESLGGGWTGHEALAIAIFSAARHSQSFEDAIISSVNHSGDSDSTGAICGNIMGCLLGRNAIPSYFTENLELLGVIEEMANDIYTGCIISEYNHYGTPEMARWDMKYLQYHWTPAPDK
jgi:ADP-ribosylglycohydrolase